MRRCQPRPKRQELTPIPDALRESLRDAWYFIRESETDPTIQVDYDDAIQITNLCGGRTGEGKRPFEFTYYHQDENGTTSNWYLALHSLEIEDIADGVLTSIKLYVCETPVCGHKSSDPNDTCECDYIDDPHFGNIPFPAASATLAQLGIDGITADSNKVEVIRVLGKPSESGGGVKHSSLGYISPWIKYHRPDCQLHFEFGKTGKVHQITVMEPDWEPGK